MPKDEHGTHEEDELQDTEEDESEDTIDDDDVTPENTESDSDEEEEEDESEKAKAAAAKKRQKDSWLSQIKEGKKTLEDMPENLGWLKKEIKAELEKKPAKKDSSKGKISAEVREVLREERAEEEFDSLVEDLQSQEIPAEKEAELRQEYEDQLSEFPNPTKAQELKCLRTAVRLVGIKNLSDTIRERRRDGRKLPPLGGKKRSTVSKEQQTDMEKKLGGNLPPGYAKA